MPIIRPPTVVHRMQCTHVEPTLAYAAYYLLLFLSLLSVSGLAFNKPALAAECVDLKDKSFVCKSNSADCTPNYLGKKTFALVFGNDKYMGRDVGPIPDLENAANDAQRLAGLLEEKHNFSVRCLLNVSKEQALIEIEAAKSHISNLRDQGISPNDTRFIFYFSGHGFRLSNVGDHLLFPSAAISSGKISMLPDGSIAQAQVQEFWLTTDHVKREFAAIASPPVHPFMIIDACRKDLKLKTPPAFVGANVVSASLWSNLSAPTPSIRQGYSSIYTSVLGGGALDLKGRFMETFADEILSFGKSFEYMAIDSANDIAFVRKIKSDQVLFIDQQSTLATAIFSLPEDICAMQAANLWYSLRNKWGPNQSIRHFRKQAQQPPPAKWACDIWNMNTQENSSCRDKLQTTFPSDFRDCPKQSSPSVKLAREETELAISSRRIVAAAEQQVEFKERLPYKSLSTQVQTAAVQVRPGCRKDAQGCMENIYRLPTESAPVIFTVEASEHIAVDCETLRCGNGWVGVRPVKNGKPLDIRGFVQVETLRIMGPDEIITISFEDNSAFPTSQSIQALKNLVERQEASKSPSVSISTRVLLSSPRGAAAEHALAGARQAMLDRLLSEAGFFGRPKTLSAKFDRVETEDPNFPQGVIEVFRK